MAKVEKVARLQTMDATVNRQMIDLVRATNELADMPLSRGRLISEVALVDGVTTRIAHGLGVKLSGWIVVDLVDAATTGRVERVTSTSIDTSKFLALKASGWGATITVAVWVF